jgi:hypothetical protein
MVIKGTNLLYLHGKKNVLNYFTSSLWQCKKINLLYWKKLCIGFSLIRQYISFKRDLERKTSAAFASERMFLLI